MRDIWVCAVGPYGMMINAVDFCVCGAPTYCTARELRGECVSVFVTEFEKLGLVVRVLPVRFVISYAPNRLENWVVETYRRWRARL